MRHLTSKTWKEFRLEAIFDIDKGRYLKKGLMISGDTPHISAKSRDNGISKFIGNQALYSGNKLTVGKIDLSTFYQPHKFYCSHDVSVLSNDKLNEYSALFISYIIKRQGNKYSYGRQAQMNVVKRETIVLPVNSENEEILEWDFMHNTIKELITIKKTIYKSYLKNKMKNLKFSHVISIQEKEWKEFFISGSEGIFSINSTLNGIDKNKLEISSEEGIYPYITRTEYNNGINLFINKQNRKYIINEGNVITIGLDTQTVFYQPTPFYTGQNIQILHNCHIDEFTALFIIPLLKKQMEKFNWGGNGATLSRLNRTKVMLPVNKHGLPDWDYMKQFIINNLIDKYNKYLSI